ncbi:DUF2141 domain-containing protein [Aurantiacibacter flavus]|uniref:DUF2141 domain-containing protein n=1 Tax=Aurantiacibacter flavus TaxID=3145232 RepID=A0ABV0CX89_9SPHN
MTLLTSLAILPLLAQGTLQTGPDLGKAEGRCRPNERGPALIVSAVGLKDRTGNLKLEVYPANEQDFLADDNVLLNAGKTFRRVEVPVPAGENPELCIRVPGPGRYGVILLHDRDTNHRFNWQRDGIGFASNPSFGMSQPDWNEAIATAGNGRTRISITLNYLRGLRGMQPLD